MRAQIVNWKKMSRGGSVVFFALLICALLPLVPFNVPLNQEDASAMGTNKKELTLEASMLQQAIVPPSAPFPLWNQTYNRMGHDRINHGIAVSTGGFALVGRTGYGERVWLVRTDEDGNHLWNETYGSSADHGHWIVECSDGGFAIVGDTSSHESHGVSPDIWLLRTDASGTLLWENNFGDDDPDYGRCVVECQSGGFAIAGTDGYNAGPQAFHLIRTDAEGNETWSKKIGMPGIQLAEGLVEASDGRFLICGKTDNPDTYGWLVCTDQNGNHLWNRTYGGSWINTFYSIIECSSGGFALCGSTYYYLGAWLYDGWVLRIDNAGNPLWSYWFGRDREFKGIMECNNNGFVLGGYLLDEGVSDGWVAALDEDGNLLWEQTCSGTDDDRFTKGVMMGSSGNVVLAGWTDSWGAGNRDGWLLQLEPVVWVEDPINRNYQLGTAVQFNLSAWACTGIDHWWINDTTHFEINTLGTLTNKTILAEGDYWIEAQAYDPYNNYCSATFRIRVIDTLPPQWVETPTNQIVELGAGFYYDINATDPSGIDHWWISDTTNFTIDANGVITNILLLFVGSYGLQVRVYDPGDRYRSATFTVTVQDTTPPSWTVTPTDQVLEYGETLDYQLQATDPSGTWWEVDDMVHFSISSTGRLTNATFLHPQTYPLVVTVYDLYGNPLYASFSITVNEQVTTTSSPPPIPGFPFETIVIGLIVSFGLMLVYRHRKQKNNTY